MVRAGGKRTKYILFSCPPGCEVSEFDGGIMQPHAVKLLGLREPYEVERKGAGKKKPVKA
jgi:hypothetical protein